MKNATARALCVIAAILVSGAAAIAEQERDVAVTVYNQNFGVVKDVRTLKLEKGIQEEKYTDVASGIEPESVNFVSLKDPDSVIILEQNYEYDLVSAGRLLQKYIDREVTVITEDGQVYTGYLMSFDNQNVVLAEDKKEGPIFVLQRDKVRDIKCSKLPEGLITKPTLIWKIECTKPGEHRTKLSYITKGINWNADYVMVVHPGDKALDLSGWVTINNQSGATYRDAKLKLIAGDVARVKKAPPEFRRREPLMRAEMAAAPQFEEKEFFEYHMYTLPRRTTIKDRQIKQIGLLSASDISANKKYVYNGARYGKKVRVNMEFQNKKENNLGMPLPKGKIRVYKADEDGGLEFIGEDMIDHTPKDEKVRVYIGNAFDIVGERKQTRTRKISTRSREETYEIKLRNHKKEDVTVVIEEKMAAYGEWKMVESSHDYVKKDQWTIEFTVNVPKDKEITVTYTVRYVW